MNLSIVTEFSSCQTPGCPAQVASTSSTHRRCQRCAQNRACQACVANQVSAAPNSHVEWTSALAHVALPPVAASLDRTMVLFRAQEHYEMRVAAAPRTTRAAVESIRIEVRRGSLPGTSPCEFVYDERATQALGESGVARAVGVYQCEEFGKVVLKLDPLRCRRWRHGFRDALSGDALVADHVDANQTTARLRTLGDHGLCHVVPTRSLGVDADETVHYICMPLFDGDLHQLLSRLDTAPRRELAAALRVQLGTILRAQVSCLRAHGLEYNDLKLENVMYHRDSTVVASRKRARDAPGASSQRQSCYRLRIAIGDFGETVSTAPGRSCIPDEEWETKYWGPVRRQLEKFAACS